MMQSSVLPTLITVPTLVLGVVLTTEVKAFGTMVRSFEMIVAPFEESIKQLVEVFVEKIKLFALMVLEDSAFFIPVTLNERSEPAVQPEGHLLLMVIV